MSGLLVWGVLVLFVAGFAAAVLGDRWLGFAGVFGMLVAAAGVLGIALGPSGLLWVLGPALASLAHGPGPAGSRPAFDPLVRRAAAIGVLVLAASLAGIRIASGDLDPKLAVILWNLAALGVAWILVADDAREFVAGATLAVAGGGGLLLVASNAGPVTALLVGGLAAVPSLRLIKRSLGWVAPAFAAAAGLGVLVLLYAQPAGSSVADVTLSWRPAALLVVAVLLVGIFATQPGQRGLAVIPATLMLVVTSPALRWAALAAAVTLLLEPDDRGRRVAWAGLTLLAASVVLGAALDPTPRVRLIATALVSGWLLLVVGRRAPAFQVAIATGFLLTQIPVLPPEANGRVQLLAALTAVFLLATVLIEPRAGRQRLSAGLALIGVAAMTATGTLAAILLMLDAFLFEATATADGTGLWGWVRTLARSGWPPAAAFAGRTLAVLAALATSTLLSVIAIGLLLALLVTPLLDPQPAVAPPVSRGRAMAITAISLAAGLWPGWIARLGHL